jgi:hypothetical protein
MRVHGFELFGVFEAAAAAVGRVLAFEIQVAASLAWRVPVTFDLAAFAFIAGIVSMKKPG